MRSASRGTTLTGTPVRVTPLATRSARSGDAAGIARSTWCTSYSCTTRSISSMPATIGTPFSERPQDFGSSSTTTTGVIPSCCSRRISRMAAPPPSPAPTTATRKPGVRSPARRNAKSLDWKRVAPIPSVASTGPISTTDSGTRIAGQSMRSTTTTPDEKPAKSRRRASSTLAYSHMGPYVRHTRFMTRCTITAAGRKRRNLSQYALGTSKSKRNRSSVVYAAAMKNASSNANKACAGIRLAARAIDTPINRPRCSCCSMKPAPLARR